MANTQKATVERIRPVFFSVVPNSHMESQSIANYLEKTDFKTYVTIALDYEWARNTVALIKKELAGNKAGSQADRRVLAPVERDGFFFLHYGQL